MNAAGFLDKPQKNGETLVFAAFKPRTAGSDADGMPAAAAKLLVGTKVPRVVKLKLPFGDATNCPVKGLTEPRVVSTKLPTVEGMNVPLRARKHRLTTNLKLRLSTA